VATITVSCGGGNSMVTATFNMDEASSTMSRLYGHDVAVGFARANAGERLSGRFETSADNLDTARGREIFWSGDAGSGEVSGICICGGFEWRPSFPFVRAYGGKAFKERVRLASFYIE
jgi:hypothetical protein